MSRRSRARAVVLQLLYEDDLNPRHDLRASDQFLQRRLRHDVQLVEFARALVGGVRRNRPELDRRLTARTANWSLARMGATDRNILRLGAYEILCTDTPPRVVINEAIELAKRYGTEQSGQFVNGVLDRILREVSQPAAARQDAAPAEPPLAEPAAPMAGGVLGNASASDTQLSIREHSTD
jgi:N utilization substance protein B